MDESSATSRAAEHVGNSTTAGTQQAVYDPETQNTALSTYILVICASVALALTIWRLCALASTHLRTLACLHSDRQRYFSHESQKLSFFKRSLLYAPLSRKRHNREFQLSSAISMGTLPTRLELLFLAGYLATNVAFCVVDISFSDSFASVASMLRNRTGSLAVVNMIPLFLISSRNNPLIALLGISFDTYILLHRWFGRIVVLELLAHTIAFLASQAAVKGLETALDTVIKTPFLLYGLIATCAALAIAIQATGPLRHAFYETFKLLHIALAIATVIGLWYHLSMKQLPQLKYLVVAVIVWAIERSWRIATILYRNMGLGGTRTLVEALPGNACRITVTLARPWRFGPGQHAYLYFPSISLLQSHPFSAAWSAVATETAGDRIALTRDDTLGMRKTSVSFVVRARTGFTNSLYQKAVAASEGRLVTRCFVEGPYGGIHNLRSYGTVMLFAGGVGITHQVPYVRDLLNGYTDEVVATRKVVLVWVIQNPEHLEWIRPWMTEILAMERRREVLRIMLFVSRPRSTKEIHSPSATVQMFPGRPNIETLLSIEMEQQVGAMAVSVCGPGALSDEVRRAVRVRQYHGRLDLVEEAFTW